jgi:hypothetical protein
MSTNKSSRKEMVDDDETQNGEVAVELADDMLNEEVAVELAEEIVAEEIVEEILEEVAEEIVDAIDEAMVLLAQLMFHPVDKNPYYLNGRALNNLQDLVGNLDAFTDNEGLWVAAWLEYLGDEDMAARIRNWPEDFKQIVIARYNMLKDYESQ